MSQTTVKAYAEPTLKDILDRFKQDVSYSLNCVKIGLIESYDKSKGSAQVSIAFRIIMADGTFADYPMLVDIPCFILQGGGAYLSMPIKKGDSCIVLFNDRDFDTWFISGKVDAPNSLRAHSLSDGIAIVGIRSLVDALTIPTDDVVLHGANKKININNDTGSLKILIDSLIDIVTTLTINPGTMQPNAGAQAALVALKAQFALLLGGT